MTDIFSYEPKGDKKNSHYFDDYRLKIYERRIASGLENLYGDMRGVVIQVQTGDGLPYLKELYAMMPYRFRCGYISDTHKFYILTNQPEAPVLIMMEPLDPNFKDDITRLNKHYPNARDKFNARYVGEIYHTQDTAATRAILESQAFQFHDADSVENKFYCNKHILFTRLSDFTCNCVGYSENNLQDFDSLELGQPFELTQAQQADLDESAQFASDAGISHLMLGIDHMATRILADEREDAILEFLCLSNYYFWGAYNISEMNSSTNVNRNPHGNDIKSPAKVFTANNTPFMVNSFEGLPMPTEEFVRSYGRRMHHIAIEIKDGDHATGQKNIDYVVGKIKSDRHVDFLAHVFGECKDKPDLKQIFSKHSPYSLLITEYIERCHHYEGFFTKENVAALTQAASLDEEVKALHEKNPVVGD